MYPVSKIPVQFLHHCPSPLTWHGRSSAVEFGWRAFLPSRRTGQAVVLQRAQKGKIGFVLRVMPVLCLQRLYNDGTPQSQVSLNQSAYSFFQRKFRLKWWLWYSYFQLVKLWVMYVSLCEDYNISSDINSVEIHMYYLNRAQNRMRVEKQLRVYTGPSLER